MGELLTMQAVGPIYLCQRFCSSVGHLHQSLQEAKRHYWRNAHIVMLGTHKNCFVLFSKYLPKKGGVQATNCAVLCQILTTDCSLVLFTRSVFILFPCESESLRSNIEDRSSQLLHTRLTCNSRCLLTAPQLRDTELSQSLPHTNCALPFSTLCT